MGLEIFTNRRYRPWKDSQKRIRMVISLQFWRVTGNVSPLFLSLIVVVGNRAISQRIFIYFCWASCWRRCLFVEIVLFACVIFQRPNFLHNPPNLLLPIKLNLVGLIFCPFFSWAQEFFQLSRKIVFFYPDQKKCNWVAFRRKMYTPKKKDTWKNCCCWSEHNCHGY